MEQQVNFKGDSRLGKVHYLEKTESRLMSSLNITLAAVFDAPESSFEVLIVYF